jgi:hypothetical protein
MTARELGMTAAGAVAVAASIAAAVVAWLLVTQPTAIAAEMARLISL